MNNERRDRTGRYLHGIMETFRLDEVIAWLRNEEEYTQKGHNALTLVKNPVLRSVVICLQKDAKLADHHAPGPITVSVVQGKVRFVLEPDKENNQSVELGPNELLVLEETRQHEVIALEESAILLTIVNLKSSQLPQV